MGFNSAFKGLNFEYRHITVVDCKSPRSWQLDYDRL